jgi:hypothetical protein
MEATGSKRTVSRSRIGFVESLGIKPRRKRI